MNGHGPVPDLDDLRFQNLVDEAKRRLRQRCPQWSDHNVSDPGIALLEAFAYLVDHLSYRLDRLPEAGMRAYLRLLGITPWPAQPAHGEVEFRRQGLGEKVRQLDKGTRVRTKNQPPVVFGTLRPVVLPGVIALAAEQAVTQTQDGGRTLCSINIDETASVDEIATGASGAWRIFLTTCEAPVELQLLTGDNPLLLSESKWEVWRQGGWNSTAVKTDQTTASIPPQRDTVVLGDGSGRRRHEAHMLRCTFPEPMSMVVTSAATCSPPVPVVQVSPPGAAAPGASGNVPAGAICQLVSEEARSEIRVSNEKATHGGVDEQDHTQALTQGVAPPRRAVTLADHERIVRERTAGIGRVHAMPGTPPFDVHVLIAPATTVHPLTGKDLTPSAELLAHTAHVLDRSRLLGDRIELGGFGVREFGLTVEVKCVASEMPRSPQGGIERELRRYFHPLTEPGLSRAPGTAIRLGEVYRVLGGLRWIDEIESVAFSGASGNAEQVAVASHEIPLLKSLTVTCR